MFDRGARCRAAVFRVCRQTEAVCREDDHPVVGLQGVAVIDDRQIKVALPLRFLHGDVAELVGEELIECFEAAATLVTLVRQGRSLGSDLNPLEVRVLAHVPLVRLGEAETPAALGAGEAAAPLPVDPLVEPQLPPALQGLAATGTGVALGRRVREHVRPEPAHVPKQPPATRAQVLPGVRAGVQIVQPGHEARQRVRGRDRRLEWPLGVDRALLGRLRSFAFAWRLVVGTREGNRSGPGPGHFVLDQRHPLLLLDLAAGHCFPARALGPVTAELGGVTEQFVAVEAAIELGSRVLPHVAVELVQALRDALAYVARVGERGPRALRVGVLPQGPARVLAGVAIVRKGLLAARAVVALDRPVRELVHAQEVGLAEGLAADVTLEGLLPGVDAHMPDEGRLETERLTAILTDLLHFGFRKTWFGESWGGGGGGDTGGLVEARLTVLLKFPLQGVTLHMVLVL